MAEFPSTPLTLRDGARGEIRVASPDEAGAGLAYVADLHARDADHLVTQADEFERDLETYRERLRKALEDPRSLHLFAWVGGRVVGDAMFAGGAKRRVRHAGWLGLGVSPDWQRRGVGRALLTALLDWAAAHDEIERVSLRVFADNGRAIPLYRSFGFVEECRALRVFKRDDGTYADDYSMCLYVKPGAPEGFKVYTGRPRTGAGQ